MLVYSKNLQIDSHPTQAFPMPVSLQVIGLEEVLSCTELLVFTSVMKNPKRLPSLAIKVVIYRNREK